MTFSKPSQCGLNYNVEDCTDLSKTIIYLLSSFGCYLQVDERHYKRTHRKLPAIGFNTFQYAIQLSSTSFAQSTTIILTLLKPRMLRNNFLDEKTASAKEKKSILKNDAKNIDFRSYLKDQLCFFIYSCRAFSNSSLTFRADPVFDTTNCIHSFQTCLSILIDVLAFFSLSWLNNHELLFMVDKVNGNYHKLNIEFCGNMVLRYNGSPGNIQLQTKTQPSKREDKTIG